MGGEYLGQDGQYHQFQIGTDEGYGRIIGAEDRARPRPGQLDLRRGHDPPPRARRHRRREPDGRARAPRGPRLHRRLRAQGPRLLLLRVLPLPHGSALPSSPGRTSRASTSTSSRSSSARRRRSRRTGSTAVRRSRQLERDRDGRVDRRSVAVGHRSASRAGGRPLPRAAVAGRTHPGTVALHHGTGRSHDERFRAVGDHDGARGARPPLLRGGLQRGPARRARRRDVGRLPVARPAGSRTRAPRPRAARAVVEHVPRRVPRPAASRSRTSSSSATASPSAGRRPARTAASSTASRRPIGP